MPTYDYHYEACKHILSVIQTFAEHEKEKPVCPKYNEKDVKQLISIFSGQIGRLWKALRAGREAYLSEQGAIPFAGDRIRPCYPPSCVEVQAPLTRAPGESHRFFCFYISSPQRISIGNTLITEGDTGRIFEVTPSGELVWEYLAPYHDYAPDTLGGIFQCAADTYRAYGIPYDYIPSRFDR